MMKFQKIRLPVLSHLILKKNASASFIQKVLTETEYASKLQRTFDEKINFNQIG
ncbi:MAG: hypothetical protein IPM74_16825 [Crocinitomicaceae bacterium]|nr:hypothetical protein [Crocinitomicaceae bacterium]